MTSALSACRAATIDGRLVCALRCWLRLAALSVGSQNLGRPPTQRRGNKKMPTPLLVAPLAAGPLVAGSRWPLAGGADSP
jgi:hypothetical protein